MLVSLRKGNEFIYRRLWSNKNVAFIDPLKMMRQYRALDLLNTLYMCYLQRKHNITILDYQVNLELSARHYQLYYITMAILWILLLFLLLFMVNTHRKPASEVSGEGVSLV